MIRATVRTSRKPRRCITCDRPAIKTGDRYREIVMSPNHNGLGYPGWMRGGECASCADTYGRGFLINNTNPSNPATHQPAESTR
ncbi:hypothetical protein [Saccharopolyspora pogona]|uniref:hypothetical protein n=1 Tax=Saccharopolyspora pogona TaxID=333966 RepID=UPI001682263F|nr:hypothetical protein [Saccharopolyspora pogona]